MAACAFSLGCPPASHGDAPSSTETDAATFDASPATATATEAGTDASSVPPDAGLEPKPGVQVCPAGATIPVTPTCLDAVDSGCSCVEVNDDRTCIAFCRGNLGCPPPCK
jgi:hypothetical protein